jgi:alginate O-acetyltransferase complex protein AlgI
LGGNRKGAGRTIFNLLVVWLVTGMWHGSTINFPLWGLSLFFFIALERLFLRRFMEKHHLVSRIYIWVLLPLTWMVFAITDVSNLAVYFGRLFPFFSTGIAVNPGDFLKYGRIYGIFFLLAFLVSQPLADRLFRKHWKSWWMKAFLFVVLWVCIYQIANGLNNPFMYFSF